MLSVSSIAHAVPPEATTSVPDSVPTSDEPTTDEPTTTVDPFGLPANGDPLELGSRPGSTVQTKTPPPPPTTTTLPPPPPTVPSWVLPANSGSGRRAVYSKSLQRVWAVDSDGTVLKTHLVSGRLKWCDPRVGEYRVFSRSRYTNNIQNPAIKWGYMVRFTKGCNGDNIGFHEIPKKYGVPVQSIWQLGTPAVGRLRASGIRRRHLDVELGLDRHEGRRPPLIPRSTRSTGFATRRLRRVSTGYRLVGHGS